jgi:hypothetical protein
VNPHYYLIWHRPLGAKKWKRIGTADTISEALTLISGPGDYWLQTVREMAASLFN